MVQFLVLWCCQYLFFVVFFFSSRRRHTRCALVTVVQTCALPISLEPGASDDFTHGLRVRPRAFALRASRPAAITLRGFEVLVQLVMAAMITAPSGILPSAGSSHGAAMPRSASAEVGRRLCGFDGPAMLRTTGEGSNFSTPPSSAVFNAAAPKPAPFA